MKPAFDVKSAKLDGLAIHLHTADLGEIKQFLHDNLARFQTFQVMPFLLDVQAFDSPDQIDIAAIVGLFAEHGLRITTMRHRDKSWFDTAAANNIAFHLAGQHTIDTLIESLEAAQTPSEKNTHIEAEAVQAQVISRPTVFVGTPIRTGQQVYAENADLIVTGMVNEGAELIADGNIHVYGPMRGRVLAGASGNTDARIFIHSMQAELVSVAGIYRNFEQALPSHLHKKAVQVSLENGRLVIGAIDAQ